MTNRNFEVAGSARASALLLLFAFLAGIPGGVWLSRRARPVTVVQAPDPAAEPEADDSPGVAFAAAPGAAPGSSTSAATPRDSLEILRDRIDDLIARQDVKGLLASLRALAVMGEPEWPLAAHVADALLALSAARHAFPENEPGRTLRSTALLPFSRWALHHRESVSADVRRRAASSVGFDEDTDFNALALELIPGETDPGLVRLLAEGIARPTAAEVPSILQAARLLEADGPVFEFLALDLARTRSPEALSYLDSVASSSSSELAGIAKMALLTARPPENGFVVREEARLSRNGPPVFQRGDLILSWNGAEIGCNADLYRMRRVSEDSRAPVEAVVLRDGKRITINLESAPEPFQGITVHKEER